MAISISPEAARKIQSNLEHQGTPEGGLRLGVKGGGCSGLSYVMRYDLEKQPNDKVFEEFNSIVCARNCNYRQKTSDNGVS